MLKGVSAIVTGGASGLGRATVERLSKQGANVLLGDLASSDGQNVAKGLENVTFAPMDVTNEIEVKNAINTAVEKHKFINLIVNCAGVGLASRTLDIKRKSPHSLAEFKKILEVNSIGTFNVIRLGALIMLNNKCETEDTCRGVIVNTASIAAFDGQIGQVAYSASTGAITAMTMPIARDLSPLQIRNVTIAPGFFDTPMVSDMPDPMKNILKQYCSFPKRFGIPDEFAKLVVHIYENHMINGCVIRLDAGLRIPA